MEGKSLLQFLMRGFQFLWTLLIMAIVGNMIHESIHGTPSVVNYQMFVAVFAMLSLFLLIPATFRESLGFLPFLPFALDILNVLFWFCGAVALAAKLGVHSCSDKTYLKNNHVTNGAHDQGGRCREAQATTAFLFFGFFAYAVSAVITGLVMSGSGGVSRGGIRRGPAMSQV